MNRVHPEMFNYSGFPVEDTIAYLREHELGPTFTGMPCEVYSFGRWYSGAIVTTGRKTITVTYTTGRGKTRTKRFGPARVRVSGQPVHP